MGGEEKNFNNDEFYNKINLLISNFLGKKNVGYAILLNGKWGSGKTYYCDKILSDFLKDKNKDKYVIRVSLFGKTDFSEIWDDIIFECFNHYDKKVNKFLIKIQGFLNNYSLNIERETKKGSYGFSIPTDCLSGLFKTLNTHDKNVKEIKDTALIVFDDLERCDSDSLIKILGQINFDLIEKGYHVMFVANNDEIGSENYKKWKEKIIRNTFTLPFNHNVIDTIIDEKNKSFSNLIDFDIDFQPFVEKINNFRTWLYALDAFIELFGIVSKNKLRIPKDELFYSILLKCYYIRKGEDIKTEIFGESSEEFLDFKSNSNNKDNDFETKVSKDFNLGQYRNLQIPFLDLSFLDKYIKTGIIDEERICKEIKNYYPDKDKFNDAYRYFKRRGEFERMDQDDYIIHIGNLYNGLLEDKYKPLMVIDISKYLEDNESLLFEIKALEIEYKENIKNYFKNKIERFYKVFSDWSSEEIYKVFPKFLNELFEKIKEGALKEKDKIIINRLNEVFFIDNSKPYDYSSLPDEIFNRLFFYLHKYKKFDSLVKLDCSKIYILKSYLRHLLEIVNAGEVYRYELEGLESFKSFISGKNNKKEFKNIKSYYCYQSLIKDLEQCCDHMRPPVKRA